MNPDGGGKLEQSEHTQRRVKQRLLEKREETIRNFELEHIKDASGLVRTHIVEKSYVDGSKFRGEIVKDKRTGNGIFYYSNGDVYAGEWKEDEFNGFGDYMYCSGEYYRGLLKHGKKHGKGTYYYLNAGEYEGMWALDKKNGFGTFRYSNGGTF